MSNIYIFQQFPTFTFSCSVLTQQTIILIDPFENGHHFSTVTGGKRPSFSIPFFLLRDLFMSAPPRLKIGR
jgi:hypothetical protein